MPGPRPDSDEEPSITAVDPRPGPTTTNVEIPAPPTVAELPAAATVAELPAVDDDDEVTRRDPAPPRRAVLGDSGPTDKRPAPARASERREALEPSTTSTKRSLFSRSDGTRLHPLVPLSVALGLLALLLLAASWLFSSPPTAPGEEPAPARIRNLFDW